MKSWSLLGEPPRTLKETMMEAEYNHLSHATWECKYHVVFTPKYRKKLLFGKIKRHLGQVFHDLARRKECRIEEGHLMPDHVHMLISIPVCTENLIRVDCRLADEGVMLPVIYVTGNDSPGNRKAAMESGCAAYLTKPFAAKS